MKVAGFEAPDDGEMTAVTVDGEDIAIARVRGELYAFQDECTHQKCALSDGDIEGTNVVCPCHMGTFDVKTGEVVDGPPDTPLRTWAVLLDGDDLELKA